MSAHGRSEALIPERAARSSRQVNALSLEDIRSCLEGVIPSVLATCARDGTPNVTYVSQVHFIDRTHVALSFQFFNKTRENILANPNAVVYVIDPRTARRYLLSLRYLRTESQGGHRVSRPLMHVPWLTSPDARPLVAVP